MSVLSVHRSEQPPDLQGGFELSGLCLPQPVLRTHLVEVSPHEPTQQGIPILESCGLAYSAPILDQQFAC